MNKIVLLILMMGCCPGIATAQQLEAANPEKPAIEPPVIDYIAIATVEYCEGDCIALSPQVTGEVTTFSWIIPDAVSTTAGINYNISACFESAGSFPATFVVSNSAGSDSMTLYVLLHPNPTPILTESDGLLTVNGEGIVYYTWFLNDTYLSGSTSNTLTPTTEGWYRCNAQAMWGCDAWTDSMFVTPASVANVPTNAKPLFWVSGRTLFTRQASVKPIEVTIIDGNGRRVWYKKVSVANNLPLPHLPAGRYLIGIQMERSQTQFLKYIAVE